MLRLRSGQGWGGASPGSWSTRGLRRLPRWLAAAGVAVPAAPRQLELGSRPAGGSQDAGHRGGGGGGCRGGRRARARGTRRGRGAGRRPGGGRVGPRGDPDETVVDGEQHGGQRDAEEVGADRGQTQPAAPRALAQARAAGALAPAAHAARAPHLHRPLRPARARQARPLPGSRPKRRVSAAPPPPGDRRIPEGRASPRTPPAPLPLPLPAPRPLPAARPLWELAPTPPGILSLPQP